MPEISIIIPVFNSSQYLVDCLESVLAQNFSDLEIICINDGSTDHSLGILKKYSEKDSRFIIIDQPNKGVSEARNAGLAVASGKYVGFIDSDDKILPDYLCILYRLLQDSDLAVCGYTGHSEMSFQEGTVDLKTADFQTVTGLLDTGLLYAPWGKLYKTEIIKINQIRFPNNINYGEDLIFNLKYLNTIQTIGITSEILYDYNVHHANSLAKKYSIKRFADTNIQIGKIADFLSRLFSDEPMIQYYISEKLYWNAYDACFYVQNNFQVMKKEERLSWIRNVINFPYFALEKKYDIKPHFLVNIFNLKCVTLIYLYLYLRKKILKC